MASVPASAQWQGQPALTSIRELSAQVVLRCSCGRPRRSHQIAEHVCRAAVPDHMQQRRMIMLRNALFRFAAVALAVALIGATFVPDDALARGGRGGGVRAGGFHAGGVHAAGLRGGAVAGRGAAYRGVAYRGGAYRGAAWRGAYPYGGAAVGAAAVGAAAAGVGAARYYGSYGYANGCYRNAAGYMVCSNQY